MHINMQKHSRIVTGGVGGLSRGAASRAQAQGRALQSEGWAVLVVILPAVKPVQAYLHYSLFNKELYF